MKKVNPNYMVWSLTLQEKRILVRGEKYHHKLIGDGQKSVTCMSETTDFEPLEGEGGLESHMSCWIVRWVRRLVKR